MKYLTGIFALNLSCNLNTCGDWHSTSINWKNPDFRESSSSILKDYGIEKGKSVYFLNGQSYNVANHIRALLDMLVVGNYGYAQGMKEEYICNDEYTKEIFEQVIKLKNLKNWNKINDFMKKEYKLEWVNFVEDKKIKVEISYRNKRINNEKFNIINNIKVYPIDKLLAMKINAYNSRDKIRDLYDIVFIIKNYKEEIPNILIDQLKNSFEYKGLEQFDYLIKTQNDSLIDKEKLAGDLLEIYDDLGLIDDYQMNENEIINVNKNIINNKANNLSKEDDFSK